MRTAAELLIADGWLVIRVNSGLIKVAGDETYFRPYIIYGINKSAGFPDLMAFKNNQFMLVEMKQDKERLRESQLAFFKYAKQFGVKCHVAHTPAACLELARKLCKQ